MLNVGYCFLVLLLVVALCVVCWRLGVDVLLVVLVVVGGCLLLFFLI